MKLETLKQLEENIGITLQCISIGKELLNRNLLAKKLRPTIENRDLVKLNDFCTAKKNQSGEEEKQNGRESLLLVHLTRDYSPDYTKNSIKQNKSKQTKQNQ